MKELFVDAWALIVSVFTGAFEVTKDVVDLAIVEDPFWRGVELTLLVGFVIMKRKSILDMLDRVPLVGGVLAFVPRKVDDGCDWLMLKVKTGLDFLKSKTIDPVRAWISKADKKLRD